MKADVRRQFEDEGEEPTEPVPFRILGDGGSLVILTVLLLRFAQFLQTNFSVLPPIGQYHFLTLSYSSFILLFGVT
jgi:hypothetical protein